MNQRRNYNNSAYTHLTNARISYSKYLSMGRLLGQKSANPVFSKIDSSVQSAFGAEIDTVIKQYSDYMMETITALLNSLHNAVLALKLSIVDSSAVDVVMDDANIKTITSFIMQTDDNIKRTLANIIKLLPLSREIDALKQLKEMSVHKDLTLVGVKALDNLYNSITS